MDVTLATGDQMQQWARDLWPIPRSITGDGVRRSLQYLQSLLPGLHLTEIPSGSRAFDWTIPEEWNITDAFIEDSRGRRVVDWRQNNLHVIGYSIPIDTTLTLDELDPFLHSLPEKPEAIPYVTAYYDRRWGFCLPHRVRQSLQAGTYRVVINSEHSMGSLTYGELLLPGKLDDCILLSTYVCHPSMANNELSGPVLLAALGRWLSQLPDLRYSYRLVFAPETIGSLAYLSRNLPILRQSVRAGWVVTCAGDQGPHTRISSRLGSNLSDRILDRVMARLDAPSRVMPWLRRGSDERQWCAPGVDLPVCTYSRSFVDFPEYHTSLDDFTVVTPQGLSDSLHVLSNCIRELEDWPRYRSVTLGEPHMSPRGLYPALSVTGGTFVALNSVPASSTLTIRDLMTVLSMCDGDHDAKEIQRIVELDADQVQMALAILLEAELVSEAGPPVSR